MQSESTHAVKAHEDPVRQLAGAIVGLVFIQTASSLIADGELTAAAVALHLAESAVV